MAMARRRSSRLSIINRRQQEEQDEAEVFYYSGIERVPNDVTVIHLHENMKTLKYRAFNCKKFLRKVQFHDTSLRTISEQAFAYCAALEEAILPDSLVEIERGAFTHCTALHTVSISPRSTQLTVIAQGAFSYCKSLVTFQVPPSVHTIERSAFSRCERLQHVEFVALEPSESSPEGLESQLRCIQPIAFGGCTSLQTFRLPHGLKTIQNQAFSGCTWLDGIEIPATVEEISSMAFAGCHNLKHLALPQDMDMDDVPEDVFQQCHLLNPMLLSAMQGVEANDGDTPDAKLALQNRFEGLPIHELCYYSQDPEVLEQLLLISDDDADSSFATQDCFGMTPFHLLALSASQHKIVLTLLKILLKDARFQKVVTQKDIWGYAPLVYACQADAPLPVVKFLLDVHQAAATASEEQIIATEVGPSQPPPPEEDTNSDGSVEDSASTTSQEDTTPKPPTKAITVPWNHLVRHCVSNSVKILRFIVRTCLKDRIQRLGLQQWKTDVTFSIFQIPAEKDPEEARTEHIRAMCRQLSTFEERDALAILEMAVWKVALANATPQESEVEEKEPCGQSPKVQVDEGGHELAIQKIDGEEIIHFEMEKESPEEILRRTRQTCRVRCNADVVVINVRQFFNIPPTDFF